MVPADEVEVAVARLKHAFGVSIRQARSIRVSSCLRIKPPDATVAGSPHAAVPRRGHGIRVRNLRVVGGGLDGKLHVGKLVQPAARADPQIAFAVFEQGLHGFIIQPVRFQKKVIPSVLITGESDPARADPQHAVPIHEQGADFRLQRRNLPPFKAGIIAIQPIPPCRSRFVRPNLP